MACGATSGGSSPSHRHPSTARDDPGLSRSGADALAPAPGPAAAPQQPPTSPATAAAARTQLSSPPTHFLALQVSHAPSVLAAISLVQASLVDHTPALRDCLLEPETAHLTVLVACLDSADRLAAAQRALLELRPALDAQALLKPLPLRLQGLGSFRKQVLYLGVAPDEGGQQLLQLGAAVQQHFRQAGLMHEDGKEFNPHVTIAKTSRLISSRRKQSGRLVRIEPEAYQVHAEVDAGVVEVTQVQLCAMAGRRQGSYYDVEAVLQLQSN